MSVRAAAPPSEYTHEASGRPARLHRFSAKQFERLRDQGILFPF